MPDPNRRIRRRTSESEMAAKVLVDPAHRRRCRARRASLRRSCRPRSSVGDWAPAGSGAGPRRQLRGVPVDAIELERSSWTRNSRAAAGVRRPRSVHPALAVLPERLRPTARQRTGNPSCDLFFNFRPSARKEPGVGLVGAGAEPMSPKFVTWSRMLRCCERDCHRAPALGLGRESRVGSTGSRGVEPAPGRLHAGRAAATEDERHADRDCARRARREPALWRSIRSKHRHIGAGPLR